MYMGNRNRSVMVCASGQVAVVVASPALQIHTYIMVTRQAINDTLNTDELSICMGFNLSESKLIVTALYS